MKFSKIISKGLVLGIILNSISFNSFANTSLDTRYEDFQGDNYSVDNLIKGTNSDFEIEGHTMINVFDYSKMSSLTSTPNRLGFSINGKEVTCNYTTLLDYPNNTSWDSKDVAIRNGETYTFVVDITKNTLNQEVETYPYMWQFAEWRKGSTHIKPGYTGKSIISFKAKMDYKLRLLYRHVGHTTTGEISMSNIMLLKGDYYDEFTKNPSKIPNYFEGIKSTGQDNDSLEIISENNNLFDNNISFTSTTGLINSENGNYLIPADTKTNWYTTPFIKVKPDTTYTITVGKELVQKGCRWTIFNKLSSMGYDYIRDGCISNPNYSNIATFKTDSNTTQILVAICNDGSYISQNRPRIEFNITMSYGEKSNLDYVIHERNNIEIPLREPLRGIPGGAKDKILKKNGKWYIERNVGYAVIDGSEKWNLTISDNGVRFFEEYNGLNYKHYHKLSSSELLCDKLLNNKMYLAMLESEYKDYSITTCLKNSGQWRIATNQDMTLDEFKEWLATNKPEVYYELETPIYEPINKDLSLHLYPDMSYISSNSNIPANIKITVDRILNRVVEAVELAKTNPTMENLSKARMWINLLDESTEKDYFQNELDIVTNIDDLQMELKTASANLDVYIKCENMLSMSLDTNQISFNDFSGIEDVEKTNAVNVSINSSLPYQLNAYLPNEIQNSDKSKTMNKEILQLKESNESDYKEFANINEKVVLKDNCSSGNQLVHGIDIMLKGGVAHEKDVYKAVIKLEAEQK